MADLRITEDDAAFMYARACRAWYGRRAPKVAKRTIKQLEQARDESGVRIWSRIADHLAQLAKDGSHAGRR